MLERCRHGQITDILLANWAPQLLDASSELKNCSVTGALDDAVASVGCTTVSLHWPGAFTSLTGSFSASAKSTN
jgi:hypothetical protein